MRETTSVTLLPRMLAYIQPSEVRSDRLLARQFQYAPSLGEFRSVLFE